MPINILMPALSPTMEEGNLAKWFVKEGDTVAAGDVIAEIETDKATMEVDAVDEGTVGKILVQEGAESVKVNEVIAVLLEDGEDAGAITAAAAPPKPAAPIPVPGQETNSESAQGSVKYALPARSMPTGSAPISQGSGGRVFASPLAKRLAGLNALDLGKLIGTGPHGRIVKRDIEAALAAGTGKAERSALPKPAAADAALKLFEEGSYEMVPHDNMRKTIAKRLTESKQQVPHFYLSMDCELDALLAMRKQANDGAPKDMEGKPAYKISVNDIVIKAHALALKAVPDANASWTDSGMLIHRHADVGVAVAIDGGLITPIVRNAEEKSLSEISAEMKDLAARARDRKLMPQEYQGGTTAVSNLGMFGIKEFSAVINPPHATILAVGAGTRRAVVKDGEIAAATVMTVTLSTDHRAVDGALGARLLQAFKGYVENPLSILV